MMWPVSRTASTTAPAGLNSITRGWPSSWLLTTPITPTLMTFPSASVCSMISRRRGQRRFPCRRAAARRRSDRRRGPKPASAHRQMIRPRVPSTLTKRSPGMKPAIAAGLSGAHFRNQRFGHEAAVDRKHDRKHRDGEQEVERRPGKDRDGALPDRLGVEGHLALGLGQRLDFGGVRRARRIHVADEFHVAAERDRGQLPARAVAVVEAEKFGPEADRKGLYADAAPAPDQIVAHFMDEHDDGQDEQERYERAEQDAAGAENREECIAQVVPSNFGRSRIDPGG